MSRIANKTNIPALFTRSNITLLSRFHVSFWQSHIFVYLFYLCPSFCQASTEYNK